MHSKEKDEACLGFLEEIFTKSVHRGGVPGLNSNMIYSIEVQIILKHKLYWKAEAMAFGLNMQLKTEILKDI